MRIIIKNGVIVTPERVHKGTVIVNEGIISEIRWAEACSGYSEDCEDAEAVDAAGNYVLPGLIDFHCDMLEHAIQPRKNVFFPIGLALQSIEKQYLSAGITSVLHPISFSGEPGIRSNDKAKEIAYAIGSYRDKAEPLLRNFIHIRCELTNVDGFETAKQLVEDRIADLFSIMDHSPRYSKFKSYEEYKGYIEKNSTLSGTELEDYTRIQWNEKDNEYGSTDDRLAEVIGDNRTIFATHDDCDPQRVEKYRRLGSTVSEFPLNEETALYAMKKGMFSVVGAPNLLRNKSHAGNLSARYAIENKLANILCSDYYCFSLLASVFSLFEDGMGLEEAVSYAALNPARAIGLERKLGSIEKGKHADIIIVHHTFGGFPTVQRAMVRGRWNLTIS